MEDLGQPDLPALLPVAAAAARTGGLAAAHGADRRIHRGAHRIPSACAAGSTESDAARPADHSAAGRSRASSCSCSAPRRWPGGMTAERDEGVIDYQRLIPMSPLAKVLGYLFGLPVREYVMFLATLPFTAWSLWRGRGGVAGLAAALYRRVQLHLALSLHRTADRHGGAQPPLGVPRLDRAGVLPLHGDPADGEVRPGVLQVPDDHAGVRGEPCPDCCRSRRGRRGGRPAQRLCRR